MSLAYILDNKEALEDRKKNIEVTGSQKP